MRNFFFLFSIIFILFSCEKKNPYEVDVSHIEVDLTIKRFDQDFYTSPIEDLPKLKAKYRLFFPETVHDSVWIQKKENKDELELFRETQKIYSNLDQLEDELVKLFKHIKYCYPGFQVPKVTTILSNIDYDYRVVFNQENLIISLDSYLGKNHKFYTDYPFYIKENNTKEAIIVDVAEKIAKTLVPMNSDRSLLGKMIFEGKKQYLLDIFLPDVSDKLKSGYTEKKLTWAEQNQEQVWKYFIEKDMLYSTDPELDKRFLDIAPFSKFYLSLDNKSPGQIGKWIGWQIVRSYMEKNDVSLQSLMKMKAQDLLKAAKYKPRN